MLFPNNPLDFAQFTADETTHKPLTMIYGYPVLYTGTDPVVANKLMLPTDYTIPLVVARYTELNGLLYGKRNWPVIYTTALPVTKPYRELKATPLQTKAVFVYSLFFLGALQRQGVRMDRDCFVENWGDCFNWFFLAWDPKDDRYFMERIYAANEAINQCYYWGWLRAFHEAFHIVAVQYRNYVLKEFKHKADMEFERFLGGYRTEDIIPHSEEDKTISNRRALLRTLEQLIDRLVQNRMYHVPYIDEDKRRSHLATENFQDTFFSQIWLRYDDKPDPDFTFDDLCQYSGVEHAHEAWSAGDFTPSKG